MTRKQPSRFPGRFIFSLFSCCLLSFFLLVNLGACTNANSPVNLQKTLPDQAPEPGETTEAPEAGPQEETEVPVATPKPSPFPEKPVPSAEKVARIICESQAKDGMTFNTLRGDVMSSYVMPSLTLYVDDQSVLRVKSPIPLRSNGEQVFLILRAQEDNFTPWKIYKTTADLLTSRGTLQTISNYPGLNPKAEYAYQTLKLENRLLSANLKKTAYVYPDNSGKYIWESLKGSKLALPFSADEDFSPTFIAGDDVLRFDQVSENGLTLTQKFYYFNTKKTLSLPPPAESRDFQLFGFVSAEKANIYWVEGHPEGAWKLRSMALNKPSAKAITLGILPGTARNLILPMVITEAKGELLLAYLEEELAQDSHGQFFLKTGVLHLVKASGKLGKFSEIRTVDYSEEIKNTPQTQPTLLQGVLRHLFFEPLSGKLYASVVSQGGLASFDLKRRSWETHAMVASIFGCLSPDWGIEITHE